jgi:hypothetical protein
VNTGHDVERTPLLGEESRMLFEIGPATLVQVGRLGHDVCHHERRVGHLLGRRAIASRTHVARSKPLFV